MDGDSFCANLLNYLLDPDSAALQRDRKDSNELQIKHTYIASHSTIPDKNQLTFFKNSRQNCALRPLYQHDF